MSTILFYILLSIIFWGSAPILEKIALRSLTPIEGVTIRSILVAIMMAAVVVFSGQHENIRLVHWRAIVLMGIAGVLAGGVGYLTYYTALKSGNSSLVVPMTASYPLVTVILSIIFLGESLTVWRVLGATLVVAGVGLLQLRSA